ncbi:hypothetical protein [Subtercola sp. YIM 133946]|uniref:hypothetical protein n=1 Tax=Subtercola sp. YIM 133946 TaxID=3118909 RepID=UPI002F9323A6
MTYLVYINDHRHDVSDGHIADLEDRIMDAVRIGGAFVEVFDGGSQPVRVLVTPATAVRIQRAPRPIIASSADTEFPDFAFYDLDDFTGTTP